MQLGIVLYNGDWLIVNGTIKLANYLLSKIKIIFEVQRSSWLYDKTLGSDIPQLPLHRGNVTSAQISQLLIAALNPLITNNEISNNINIVCTFETIGIFKFEINLYDITGNYFKFNYTVTN